ncbi:hypothetical protein SAMN04488543_3036 [Friedmanniella luteola]|uniref:Uncharacterized protein n=1 Tax=Friedmanniella luteola TaxID=546871 RepID=A0A1H1XLX5_9ACTN|nr:hypothetical protein [Friedmanniella luteola]SDT10202.1 hypothetical protein SAMN04488543_3036 [Friedmanniella luteola]
MPGHAGLRLTVVHSGHPVTLTAVTAERAEATRTSLGLPLPLLSPAYEPGGKAAFYSTVPGAFVDLAADLTYVLDRSRTRAVTIELDGDLPLVTSGVLVTGLEDLAALNRAAGILIARGQDPGTAPQALRTRAGVAGLTPLAYAHRLLGREDRIAGRRPAPLLSRASWAMMKELRPSQSELVRPPAPPPQAARPYRE